MTERQRDLFLYQWSRRRTPGRARVALRGAVVGALGGVAFAWILTAQGAQLPGVHAYDIAGQIRSILRLLALAVPAFAFLGWVTTARIWTSQERIYQGLLATGARVPTEKPVLAAAERGPQLAVAVAVAVIAGLVLALFWAARTGRL